MKTSVVMTTFNGEKYLYEQLESILFQTIQPDEVLIFDDCSTDSTVIRIEKFIKENGLKNWSLIINKQNKGWRKNFVEGLLSASGDIIFPCDQDDIWMPEKIEVCTRILEKNQNIQLLVSNYQVFYDDKDTVDLNKEKEGLKQIELDVDILNIPYPGCTYCIRKNFVQLLKKYWQSVIPHDVLLYDMALFKGTLYSTSRKLILWRSHSDSAFAVEIYKSRTKDKRREWIANAEVIVGCMYDFVNSENCNSKKVKKLLEINSKWLKCRKLFYDTRNLFKGLKLCAYIKLYASFKQFLADYYFVLFDK